MTATKSLLITESQIKSAIDSAIASDHSRLHLHPIADSFMGCCRVYVEILGFTGIYQRIIGEVTPATFKKKVAPLIEKICNDNRLTFRYKVGSLSNAIYCGYRNDRSETQVRKAHAIAEALREIGLSAFVECEGD